MNIRDEMADIINDTIWAYCKIQITKENTKPYDIWNEITYKILSIPIMTKCDECKGLKYITNDFISFKECPTCKGKKEVPVMREVDCPDYDTDGDSKNCNLIECNKKETCNGTGKIKIPVTWKDRIEGVG